MKKRKQKSKILLISLFTLIPIGTSLSGIGVCVPGMGMDTLKLKKSIEDTVAKKFPKGKYIFNIEKLTELKENGTVIQKPLASQVLSTIRTTIKSTVEDDVFSTINSNELTEDFYNKLKVVADNWFDENIDPYFSAEDPKNIDLNEFSLEMIDFDKSVAAINWGVNPETNNDYPNNKMFVESGLEFLFQKNIFGQIFSNSLENTELYRGVVENTTVVDQDIYNENQLTIKTDLLGCTQAWTFADIQKHNNRSKNDNGSEVLLELPATHVANNKIWFLEAQLDTIKNTLNNPLIKLSSSFGIDVFVNQSNLSAININTKIDSNLIYTPNYSNDLKTLRIGLRILIIGGPISLFASIIFIALTIYIYKKIKEIE